ncbi:uncharacterized protein PV09_05905 [Verruconis gallopava]|uniref:WLM domain-containing protein n=1 Tax=Verruconis gallopava TaxID=253628 RepID=A0A0D2A8C8_9PEZI|nr:uncharacterized protein PV09_05905 [Verruconis gallopava]KIW02850.1 hypothetical protein PV09_05905 [Verruconis gallopava]
MPLGFERLNERVSRPNKLINFLRPLPGSTAPTAQEFLERIAAQCYPVMKANGIAVMTLEEYPWNTEFIGRNFNAGEVIQLVLRSKSGAWLPFRHVQLTMMHELAHCKEMNHSRAFWRVRNQYANEMRELWAKNYSGEGLWGRGQSLESGRFMSAPMPDQSEMPEHMCGGTYRRRGRKRKRTGDSEGPRNGNPQLSYAERKQRRIHKKFEEPAGKGVTLGDDESVRVKLESGKKAKGKPRVAGSNRGRELRAAAALARLEQAKKESETKSDDTESDTEDEFDWPPSDDESAVERDGKAFVRTCEAEDEHDDNVKRELEELYELGLIPEAPCTAASSQPRPATPKRQDIPHGAPNHPHPQPTAASKRPVAQRGSGPGTATGNASDPDKGSTICPACSLANEASAMVCAACSNVLRPERMPNHWRCQSDTCRGGVYINVGDYGRCQVCDTPKPV